MPATHRPDDMPTLTACQRNVERAWLVTQEYFIGTADAILVTSSTASHKTPSHFQAGGRHSRRSRQSELSRCPVRGVELRPASPQNHSRRRLKAVAPVLSSNRRISGLCGDVNHGVLDHVGHRCATAQRSVPHASQHRGPPVGALLQSPAPQ